MKKIPFVGLLVLLLTACYPPSYSSIYVPPKPDCIECYSNANCDIGERCFKADYNITGCCGRPVDKYGVWQYVPYTTRKIPGCMFNTDCPIGFKCVKQAGQSRGVCIKRY
ncbi:MAG: hypothetical protein ACE5KJ_03430 [Candidatus Zixiibacteriota bacterium]